MNTADPLATANRRLSKKPEQQAQLDLKAHETTIDAAPEIDKQKEAKAAKRREYNENYKRAVEEKARQRINEADHLRILAFGMEKNPQQKRHGIMLYTDLYNELGVMMKERGLNRQEIIYALLEFYKLAQSGKSN